MVFSFIIVLSPTTHFNLKNFCEILCPTFSAAFSRLNCSTSSYSEIIVPFLYNIVNQFRSQSTTVFFYTSLSFQATQKELKPCINARFQPFYDLITFYTFCISKLCEFALFTHLFCQLLFTVFSNAHFIRLSTLSSILLFHFTQFPFG